MATSPPPPIPSPAVPGNGSDEKPTTGEFAKLQVEAKKEDARRTPASHWDLVKSTIAILGTLAGIVLGFVAFGDRVVARAEGKTANGVQVVKETLKEHVEASNVVHADIKEALQEIRDEQKEQRADTKALYHAMPGRRTQPRLEVDVEEPSESDVRALGISMPTPMPRPRPDGGR